jgi:hypothetical protein
VQGLAVNREQVQRAATGAEDILGALSDAFQYLLQVEILGQVACGFDQAGLLGRLGQQACSAWRRWRVIVQNAMGLLETPILIQSDLPFERNGEAPVPATTS